MFRYESKLQIMGKNQGIGEDTEMNDKQTILTEKYLGKLEMDDPNLQKRLGRSNPLTYISLFSGCGGLDCGFAKAGIETRVMIEWAKYACDTLRANFLWEELKKRTKADGTPQWKTKEEMKKQIDWYHDREPVIIQKDIKEVSTKEILEAAQLNIGECSIISGGFPCQGFSVAGKRVIDDPRNFLYREFVRIVNEAKPAMIMGENVPGLVSMDKGEVIMQICQDFANCGYDITWDILNAADYGVPQIRKRVILIGKRVDVLSFNGDKRPSLHIGGEPGRISYPILFKDRLKKWKRRDILKNIEENPRVSFFLKGER